MASGARRIVWLLLMVTAVWAEEPLPPVTLHEVTDFAALGEEARRRNLPILLMFSADHCPYCVRVKEEFLKPMLRSGDYEGQVMIRRIELDAYDKVRDFDGSEVYRADLSDRYGVRVTPTLVYLDHTGRPLAEKMVGLSTPDFYGGYIDTAIETARGRLKPDGWQHCENPRPQICTMEYRPVCGEGAAGRKTYSNACGACADPAVTRHRPGSCDES